MRSPTYKSTLPTPGSDVAAFVAGLRNVPYELSTALKQSSYHEGRERGLRLPRRLAKRRATRILWERRRAALRWGSRGNTKVANPTFDAPGFVRVAKPSHVKEEGTPEQRALLESKGWMAPTPDDKFDGKAWGATEAIASLSTTERT